MATIAEALGGNPGETIMEALGGHNGETIAEIVAEKNPFSNTDPEETTPTEPEGNTEE